MKTTEDKNTIVLTISGRQYEFKSNSSHTKDGFMVFVDSAGVETWFNLACIEHFGFATVVKMFPA